MIRPNTAVMRKSGTSSLVFAGGEVLRQIFPSIDGASGNKSLGVCRFHPVIVNHQRYLGTNISG
jgi:hypothetical protein